MFKLRTSATPHSVNTDRAFPDVSVVHVWAALRIVMGWSFLWVFLDRLFGLGFPTHQSWINGGNPVRGILLYTYEGPLHGVYDWCAAEWPVQAGLMAGLFIVGVGTIFGTWYRIASIMGAVIYLLMWSARFPPTNNPITDDHLMGALIMIGLLWSSAGSTWSFYSSWKRLPFISGRKYLQ